MQSSDIALLMLKRKDSTLHDVSHFMKVWAFARVICDNEKLPQKTALVIETAALVHDIACPAIRDNNGHSDAGLQQSVGREMAREFLKDTALSEEDKNTVCSLVATHHTYDAPYSIEHQVLIEADYIVNAEEQALSYDKVREFADRYFKTRTGLEILEGIFKR